MRRRRMLFALAALGGSLILAVGLAEGALWIFAPVAYHEFVEWIGDGHIRGRMRPGQVVDKGEGEPFRINRLGFRGPDWDWEPAPGTLRLVALGGSAVFNFWAASEAHTWPSRLGHHLSEALGMPVEVINLGLAGNAMWDSKAVYLYVGRELHPHVALAYNTWNDLKYFRLIDGGGHPISAGIAHGKPWWKRFARHFQIARRIRNALHASQRRYVEGDLAALRDLGPEAAEPIGTKGLEFFERGFRDFALLARSDGVLPVLITQATLATPQNLARPEVIRHCAFEWLKMTPEIAVDSFRRANARLARLAGELELPLVDGYSAVPSDLAHLTDGVHLTDKGMDVLARAIAKALLADARFSAVVQRVRAG